VNEEEKTLLANMFRAFLARMTALAVDESGMSTVEYAIGTIAAAAFGAILYAVVTGDSIVSALTNIIGRALNTKV
jgi:large-conductance mechanosensitive channel